MRGDEPAGESGGEEAFEEFPACAGMNRWQTEPASQQQRVPRMRGDEPYARLLPMLRTVSSPHARG